MVVTDCCLSSLLRHVKICVALQKGKVVLQELNWQLRLEASLKGMEFAFLIREENTSGTLVYFRQLVHLLIYHLTLCVPRCLFLIISVQACCLWYQIAHITNRVGIPFFQLAYIKRCQLHCRLLLALTVNGYYMLLALHHKAY
jgi:hypothetical protein